MLKKIVCFSMIVFMSISLLNVVLATDISMDVNTNTLSNNETQADNNAANTTISDNTANTALSDASAENTVSDYQSTTATTTDYADSTELSISNMINIILIVVGVVLVLLGIAIIIKLK